MTFKKISLDVSSPNEWFVPEDIQLELPTETALPVHLRHFLLFIPWDEKYRSFIPNEFRDFFSYIHRYLRVRTTDVHVAVCLSFLDELIAKMNEKIDQKIVALALLLHDIGWSQLSEMEVAQSLGVDGLKLEGESLAPKEKHADEGAKLARKILAEYPFQPALTESEIDLICTSVLYHDKPWEVKKMYAEMPQEVLALVDLDHLWSFTHQNFWQDTVRKGVLPSQYVQNLGRDLTDYFVTDTGRGMASQLLKNREHEVAEWRDHLKIK